MSTATASRPVQKGAPTRANKTEVGHKYIRQTPTGKILIVKIIEQKGNNTILEVLDDAEFDDPLSVPGTMILYEIAGKEAPIPKAKPAPVAKEPPKPEPKAKAKPEAKVKKPAVEKKNRMAKVPDGTSAPRVSLEGFNLRQFYRNRLAINRATECEKAKEAICRCRCGGALHGKPHKPWFDAENALFDSSPISAITAKDVLSLIKKFGGVKFLAARKTQVHKH